MSALRALLDFLVGDDPRSALLVVGGLALTAGLVAAGVDAWPVLPLSALVALALGALRPPSAG